MKVKIEIELGNAAMQTGTDAAWALDDSVIKKLKYGVGDDALKPRHSGYIHDLNGNMVGKWEVTT